MCLLRPAIPAELRGRPFLADEAAVHGIGPDVLRGKRFRRLFTQVYVCANVEVTVQVRVDAALLLVPRDAAACDRTAAELLGLPVPADGQTHLAVSVNYDRRRVRGIRVHRLAPSTEIATVGGRRVTPPLTTFLGLANSLNPLDLVVLGDAMVRRSLVTTSELVDAAAASNGRGVVLARRTAALVRPRVDSPMETRLRLLLVLSGLPEPETNRPATGHAGQWLATPDLRYQAERVVVEYDGRHHRERAEQYERDLPRRELMEREGWHVIVVTAHQFFGDPEGVALRVAAALRARGNPDAHVRLNLEWCDLFAPAGSAS